MNENNYKTITLPDCCYVCRHYKYDAYFSGDTLCFVDKEMGQDIGVDVEINGYCSRFERIIHEHTTQS